MIPQPEMKNLDDWVAKWTEKYGPDTALGLEKVVESNMKDYEYLLRYTV